MEQTHVRASLLPWLLEPGNPPIRYQTLRDLCGRSADDAGVRAAQAAIPTYPPVAELLQTQEDEGYWIQRDYYLPKHYGTFWVLSALADMGLTAEHEAIQRGCAFMFAQQRESGAFCRRRRVPRQGIVWEATEAPCTQARIVRFLIQLGYGADPRAQAGLGWLLATVRDDGMWLCERAGRRGCLRATLDTLRTAALDSQATAHPAIARAATIVCDLLLQPRMGRYHVDDEWTVLAYPYVDYGIIPALEALGRLGYTLEHPRIAAALGYLRSRQLPEGPWPLDQVPSRPPFDPGRPGQPNKWLTLDALRVLGLFYPPRSG